MQWFGPAAPSGFSCSKGNHRRMIRSLKRCVAVALVLAGTLGPTSAPAAPPAPAISDLDVVKATLENGLRVIVVHDALAPVVTEVVNYLVGGADTPVSGTTVCDISAIILSTLPTASASR